MAPVNYSDSELVGSIRSGRELDEPVKAIYREHFSSLSWFVMNNSGSREDAEDLFQEVVLSFINLVKEDRFRGESSVKTFLYSINRHLWLNELKRRGRSLAREEKFGLAAETKETDIAELIARQESRRQLESLVERLGDTCKKILLLFYYQNQSMKEILTTLDYENEQVVRNKKYKCLKQLEQMISENPKLEQTLKTFLYE